MAIGIAELVLVLVVVEVVAAQGAQLREQVFVPHGQLSGGRGIALQMGMMTGFEKCCRRVCRSDEGENEARSRRLHSPRAYQLSTTFPELPDPIVSKPLRYSATSKRCVIMGVRSSPPWMRAIILYQVSYISRP